MSRGDGISLNAEELLKLREFAAKIPHESESHPGYSGGIAGKLRGAGHDFYDLRAFEQGDDIRRIDASATARSGRRQIRQFHEEVDQTAILIADFRSPMFWGTRRRLRSVAAAQVLVILGWRHIDHMVKLGLVVLMDDDVHYLAPAPREAQMMKVISQLEALHLRAVGALETRRAVMPLERGLEQTSRMIRRGGVAELATGFDDPGARIAQVLERMSQRHQLRILQILDAVQSNPPKGLFPYLTQDRMKWGRFQNAVASPVNQQLPLDHFSINASREPTSWVKVLGRDESHDA